MASRDPKLQPPPNYSSRRVQTQLLLLVGLFMLVVVLMVEAGKPKNWQWMFAGRPAATGSATAPTARRDSTELAASNPVAPDPDAPKGLATDSGATETGHAAADRPRSDFREANDSSTSDPARLREMGVDASEPLARTQIDGWQSVLEAIPDESGQMLRRGLRAVREGRNLPDDERSRWRELLPRLDAEWSGYHDDALMSLAEEGTGLNAGQREQWLEVLQRSRAAWENRFRPALEGVSAGEPLAAESRAALADLQSLLDQLALGLVEDNTVLRFDEKVAWFRTFERLSSADPQDLKQASLGPVNYLQLYKQPQVYRGKLVTVRGEARLAYHVDAPSNQYGISGYYIFWLKPTSGPNSPLVVYSLETPPGFPEIKDKDRDRETTPLNEQVEFTGYFFKRWAYRARDGANTAPLMLARVPRWEPDPGPAIASSGLPSPGFAVLAVLVAVSVAGGVTAVVYFRGRSSAAVSRHQAAETAASDRLRDLSQEDHPTRIESTLRALHNFDAAAGEHSE